MLITNNIKTLKIIESDADKTAYIGKSQIMCLFK